MTITQKITTYLWFDGDAEAAATLYTEAFPDSRIVEVTRWGAGGPAPAGAVMTVTFELAGQRFIALNGGPKYRFTPAISLFVECADQAEIDHCWERLIAGGGRPTACGWLEDRFGLSWQIVPTVLKGWLTDPDPARSARTVQAMLAMQKLDVAALARAHAGEEVTS